MIEISATYSLGALLRNNVGSPTPDAWRAAKAGQAI